MVPQTLKQVQHMHHSLPEQPPQTSCGLGLLPATRRAPKVDDNCSNIVIAVLAVGSLCQEGGNFLWGALLLEGVLCDFDGILARQNVPAHEVHRQHWL